MVNKQDMYIFINIYINIDVFKDNYFTKWDGPSKIQALKKKYSFLPLPVELSILTFSFPELCGISSKSHGSYNPSNIIFRSPLTMGYS